MQPKPADTPGRHAAPPPCGPRVLPDAAATAALGAALADLARPGDALLLEGGLGAGKSTLARAFLRRSLQDPELEVPSPTYTLVQSYARPDGVPIAHFDLWRLADAADLAELGWDEALAGIVLVEWPERLGPLEPPGALRLRLGQVPGQVGSRSLALEVPPAWEPRLALLAKTGHAAFLSSAAPNT